MNIPHQITDAVEMRVLGSALEVAGMPLRSVSCKSGLRVLAGSRMTVASFADYDDALDAMLKHAANSTISGHG